jgi:hypothetical protein
VIPGPYSICEPEVTDESDGTTFRTLKWGYETAPQAEADLASAAAESGLDADELVIIRVIEGDEYARFLN